MVGSIKAGVMSNPMFIKRPRNVRNPKGVRIRAALRAAAGLLLFFLLLRSDVLPLWVCGRRVYCWESAMYMRITGASVTGSDGAMRG